MEFNNLLNHENYVLNFAATFLSIFKDKESIRKSSFIFFRNLILAIAFMIKNSYFCDYRENWQSKHKYNYSIKKIAWIRKLKVTFLIIIYCLLKFK